MGPLNLRTVQITAVAGDLAVFLLFPFLGSAGHEALPTLEVLLRTSLPFALLWVAASPLTRVYSPDVIGSAKRVALRTALAWPICGLAALALRSLLFDRPWAWAFVLVALAVQGALLLLWRAAYALVIRRMGARQGV